MVLEGKAFTRQQHYTAYMVKRNLDWKKFLNDTDGTYYDPLSKLLRLKHGLIGKVHGKHLLDEACSGDPMSLTIF